MVERGHENSIVPIRIEKCPFFFCCTTIWERRGERERDFLSGVDEETWRHAERERERKQFFFFDSVHVVCLKYISLSLSLSNSCVCVSVVDNLFLETGNPILLLCLFLSVYYIRASERERDSSFCLFSSTTKRRTVTQLSSRLTFSFLGGCVAGDNNSPPKTGGGMQPTSSNSFKKKMMKKKKLFSLHLEASVAYWEVRFFFFFFFVIRSNQ